MVRPPEPVTGPRRWRPPGRWACAALAAVVCAAMTAGPARAQSSPVPKDPDFSAPEAPTPLVDEQTNDAGRTTWTSMGWSAGMKASYGLHEIMATSYVTAQIPEYDDGHLTIPMEFQYEGFPFPRITHESFYIEDEDGETYSASESFDWDTTGGDYEPHGSDTEEFTLEFEDAPEMGALVYNNVSQEKTEGFDLPSARICYLAAEDSEGMYMTDLEQCFVDPAEAAAAFYPESCVVASRSLGVGLTGTLVVTAGRNFELLREVHSDGTASLTVLDRETSGIKLDLGSDNPAQFTDLFTGKANVHIGAGVSVENGATWLFDSEEEAGVLQRDIQTIAKTEEIAGPNPLADRGGEITTPALRSPDVVRQAVDLAWSAGYDLSAGLDDEYNDLSLDELTVDPDQYVSRSTTGALGIEAGYAREVDSQAGTTTDTFALGDQYSLQADDFALGSVGAEGEGTLSVTREGGELSEIGLTRLQRSDGKITTTAVTVELETEAERKVAQEWLDVSSVLGAVPWSGTPWCP